jgi:hypothetical protein
MSRKIRKSIVGLPNTNFFGHFLVSEFFNSHACSQQLTTEATRKYRIEICDGSEQHHFQPTRAELHS